jgi:hypothetical protein
MRIRLNLLTLLGMGLLVWPAIAQPPERPAGDPPPGDPAMKQKLLDAFDTNKDGTIDRSEARAIGRALRENFDIGPGPGGRGPEGRRGPAGPPPEDGPAARGPENRRGRGPDDWGPGDRGPARRGPDDRGRGPGGPDNPPPPRPNPERLFNRFDENKDESLSKDEFKKLTDFMREHRPMGPPMMGRGGPGRGFDGPPRDFDRRGEGRGRGWWRDAPPGPPPGPDGPPPEDGPDDAPKDAI